MVGPYARWVKWFVGGLVFVVLVVVAFDRFSSEPDPVAAEWEVAPEADLGPTTSIVPILVNEIQCASGRSAEGRVEVTIDYRADEVEFEVGVRPLEGVGVRHCFSNPNTPYTVELDEPLGHRSIVGERPITWPGPIPDDS